MSDQRKNPIFPAYKLSKQADRRIRLSLWLASWPRFYSELWRPLWSWRLAVTSALILVLGLGTTSVYAYQSDQVAYGDRLYVLKLGLEQVELALSMSGQEEVETKHLVRRLDEAAALLEKSDRLADLKKAEKAQNNAEATLERVSTSLAAPKSRPAESEPATEALPIEPEASVNADESAAETVLKEPGSEELPTAVPLEPVHPIVPSRPKTPVRPEAPAVSRPEAAPGPVHEKDDTGQAEAPVAKGQPASVKEAVAARKTAQEALKEEIAERTAALKKEAEQQRELLHQKLGQAKGKGKK